MSLVGYRPGALTRTLSTTVLLAGLVALAACNPYENFDGDAAYFGPVDPANFPAGHLGPFAAATAYAKGVAVAHYLFPAATPDPLDVSTVAPQLAYEFDTCTPPKDYVFDARRDVVRLDQQGAVFTQLPDSPGYVPLVRRVPVTSNNARCQYFKDELAVIEHNGKDVALSVMPPLIPTPTDKGEGIPDGKFFAWALIDPGAEVRNPDGTLTPETGLGPQKFGFYNRYLTAYLDGGELPVDAVPVPGMQGMPDTAITQARAQNLFYPLTVTGPTGALAPGDLGIGYDVIDAARGEDGYSPLCRVLSYRPTDPAHPAKTIAEIDPATVLPDRRGYVYCLQVAP